MYTNKLLIKVSKRGQQWNKVEKLRSYCVGGHVWPYKIFRSVFFDKKVDQIEIF